MKFFTGVYEPINWFSMVKKYRYIYIQVNQTSM